MDNSRVAHEFIELRMCLLRIDALLETDHLGDYDQNQIKEYDKALTVMKVGAKVMKRRLAKLGFKGLGRIAKHRQEGAPL